MFEPFQDALRGLSARLTPDERRQTTARMREALVHAKLALQDLRAGLAATDQRLTAEQAELDTVRRRQALAAEIGDQETVQIAERFAQQHAERVQVLETKRMAQEQELALAEREYEEMSAQLRRAADGLAPTSDPMADAMREVDAAIAGDPGAPSADEVMPPRRSRAEREAEAEARLAALKRQLGK